MIKIIIINDYDKNLQINNNQINTIIQNVYDSEKIKSAKITLILSNKYLLNKLKKNYFSLDQFTDVIAFNLEDKNEPIEGEVYISLDDVLDNSKKYKQLLDVEFKRVLIHGILHLLGLNDKTQEEKQHMNLLEEKYLKQNPQKTIVL